MVDRFGNPIRIAWAPHELEWVRAAMTLPYCERIQAYRDIADMAGRTVAAIRHKAYTLEYLSGGTSRTHREISAQKPTQPMMQL